jgi:ferredoxin-NADP reductase/MOSC domain-containing protein YiiM
MAKLLSVNVGMPKDVDWQGRTVHSGVWKRPVAGPRMVRRLNIDGDGQGDLGGHGGEIRAVLVYQEDSYRHWEQFFGRDLEHGAFGENFTIDGLSDDDVCIGDRYRIGEAEFEVTQPRVTCFRVGMRLEEPQLPSLLVAHGRPGFYLRVLREGQVSPGDEIVRTARGPHELSVAAADALLYLPGHDRARLRTALDIPALSPGWRGSFESMLEADAGSSQPAGIAAAPPPAWVGFRTVTVSEVVTESELVTSFRFAADDTLPAYLPGQFLTLKVAGAGDPVPVRTYSLSGDPSGGDYRISVKRESRGTVSRYLHEHLRQGARLEVAAPRGTFVLEEGSDPVLLVSAGIGVTPVLAMLHRLADDHSEREVWWIHTTHDVESHAFSSEVAGLLDTLGSARTLVYYSAPGRPLSQDSGVREGRLTAEVVAGLGLPQDASAYVCGPERFMDDISDALAAAGVSRTRIRTERFSSVTAINPGIVATDAPPPHQPPGPPGTGPAVTFARSGLTTSWSGSYASVLELAESCDVPTRWSCRTGVCHTCVTAVLAGETSYETPPLEAPGEGEVLICSAQPAEDLVLDL